MTKAKISEYDAVAANNTDVNGVNIAENCPPSGMNNMGREIMAALKRFQVGSDGDGVTVGGNLVVSGTSTVAALNTSGAVVFNDAGADVDFRVEGDTDANLLFVDASTDRVGIGTSSPDKLLNLRGANPILRIDNTTGGGATFLGMDATSTYIQTFTQDILRFITASSERMRIDSSGNVGIGTSTITSGGGWTPKLVLAASGGSPAWIIKGANSQELSIGASNSMYIDCSGNTTGTNNNIIFRNTSTNSSFSVTERMRIDSSGNLLVGTTTKATSSNHNFWSADGNTTTLFVRNTNASSPNGIVVSYSGAAPNGTANEFLYCLDNVANPRISLRSNGGVANYSANNVNLSDERVKKDIANLGSQWNCIKEWNLVEFRYKEQSEDAPKNYGVIAQQIQEHCPEVVQLFQRAEEAVEAKEAVLDEDGNVIEPAVDAKPAVEERIGVREQQMVWMSIKALQEAMERIETLEAKVAALENA